MNFLNRPKKQETKLKCPSCGVEFIPISYDLISEDEPSHNDLAYQLKSDKLPGFNMRIYPFTFISKYWITFCPECGYILRYVAEIGKKQLLEKVEGRTPRGNINEF